MPKDDGNESQQARRANFASLVVIYGNNIGKGYRLNAQSLVIGRSSKCLIQVDQQSISRNHAILVSTGNSWLIRDLGTTNGTYVNDLPIEEHVLSHGDLVKVGRTIFKFLSGGSVESYYHDEMYRLAVLNRAPAAPPSGDERTATTIETMPAGEENAGGRGRDSGV
jgi:pSer/pThr/pTyr-binding forkhead associated (FHA) protein